MLIQLYKRNQPLTTLS